MQSASYLSNLNPAQRAAVTAGLDRGHPSAPVRPGPPLLIIAGAGSGKTNTLAHRVAHLIAEGADPRRILLLTFTRRAAEAMIRRAEAISAEASAAAGRAVEGIEWAGTFHAVGARLLRLYAEPIGLDPGFTILDRGDAADLIDLVRAERGLARQDRRFPRKATCLSIYSHAVNAGLDLEPVLRTVFPWCAEWLDELKALFAAYVEAKQRQAVLDYDDLLLFWAALMEAPELAADVAARFDFALVDEYQDTNALQARILLGLKPDGRGLTVVGDDAQAIYGFRAATVRNILDFPGHFTPAAEVVTLEQNYRSTQPILAAANAVIDLAAERFTKNLHSERRSLQKPLLANLSDEAAEVDYVVDRVLANREAGLELRDQAVLFRTGHHSGALEIELGRRNIPFVKFGGLKFLESAHVKDVLAILRFAENPRDRVAAFRTLQMLPGIGPGTAHKALTHLEARGFDLGCLVGFAPPPAAAEAWPGLTGLLADLAGQPPWAGQIERVRRVYDPLLAERYAFTRARLADLDQLERIAAGHPGRQRFLADLTLDPPQATGAEAGVPLLDEDYLILSTIHAAKGQEWRAVFVLKVVDGCIPSDMATGAPDSIEEERRLLYVAMTRARDQLHLLHPRRFYATHQPRHGDRYVHAPRTRFIPTTLLDRFELWPRADSGVGANAEEGGRQAPLPRVDIGARMRRMWQ